MRAFCLALVFFSLAQLFGQDQQPKPASPRRDKVAAQEAETEGQKLLFQKHDVNSAIESFKKCVKLDPWYGHGYIMLGVAYTQAQRWEQAQWAFEEASKVEPGDPQSWLGQGSTLNEQKKYAEAQKALQQCLDLNPNSAEGHYEMGRTLLGLEKLEGAQLQASLAIELNKDYAGPHVLMANIYLAQFDPEGAIKEFQESLRLDPGGPDASAIKENIRVLQKTLNQPARSKKR